ncbi:MAG: aldose 1-epimerase family protein, partial [Bacillota bacterium]
MEYIIENNNLKVVVDEKGAELTSLFDKINNKEIIWQKNKEYWNRSSPTLFPFIGAIKDKGYIFNGKKYEMTRHGFVRDVKFKLIDKSKDFLSFLYKSNEKTQKMFPFRFELYINYKLNKNNLEIEYILKNKSKNKMYYNLGGHTAYNFKISDGEKYIEFEK